MGGVRASADPLMLAAVMLLQVLLSQSKCRVLCMPSIAVCRPLVGMLCVNLCSTVVCGLLLVFGVVPGAVAGLQFSIFASSRSVLL